VVAAVAEADLDALMLAEVDLDALTLGLPEAEVDLDTVALAVVEAAEVGAWIWPSLI